MLQAACRRPCGSVAAAHEHPATQSPRQRRLQKQRNQWKQQRQQQRQHHQQQPLPPPPPPPERRPHQGLGTPDAAASLQLECPHFDSCSGCTLDRQLERPPVLADAERFFAEAGAVHLKLHSGRSQRWRRRARLAVRRGPSGEPAIGLFEEGSHSVTPIPSCTVHHPAINEAVQLVHAAMAACRITPYDEASGSGQLRYLQLTAVDAAPGAGQPAAVQLVLVWNFQPGDGKEGRRLQALADRLWRAGQLRSDGTRLLHSIWANFQPERTNTILGPNWSLLHGEPWAWARLGGADVCFGPGSFMQANFEAMGSALAAMQRYVPVGATITDLHAGVGTIGLSLAAMRAPRWVEFVEVNGQGLPPFQQSAARLRQRWRLGEAHCSCSMAGSSTEEEEPPGGGSASEDGGSGSDDCPTDASRMAPPPALEYHVAAAGSDPARWCQGAEVVVLDPPRKGLEPELLHWLCSPAAGDAGVRRLLYLSCGWPALKRDAAELLGSGHWRLRHAECFLFFPGSDHIETLTVWDAAGSSGSSDWSLASD